MNGVSRSLLTLIAAGVLASAPAAWAQERQDHGARPATAGEKQEEEEDVEGMDVSFMDSTQAQWFNEAINAQLYHAGYTLNTVFSERDKVRLENNLNLYRPSDQVDVVRSSTTMTPSSRPQPVKLRLNGKLVKVSE